MGMNDHIMERRTSLILLQYWNELRGERDFPTEEEIDLSRLEHVWNHCFLVQVRDINEVHDFNYTYFGPDLRAAYDSGILDPGNGKMAAPDANQLRTLYDEVVEKHDPLLQEGTYINSQGKRILFRQSMMPIGNGQVESILGGSWFKIDEA